MKKLLFGAAALLMMTSCSGNGGSDKANEESAQAGDSITQVEATQKAEDATNVAAEQARLDSLRADSIQKAEAESFYNSLPDIKKLTIADHKKETNYLRSLGFKGSFKEKGMEEDWRADGTFTLEKGNRKCVVKAHVDGYYQDYNITITGDEDAKKMYYNKTKKITRTKYDSPIKTKLKGNTIVVEVQDY